MAKNTNKTQATAATPVTTPVMMATAEFSQATALANQILTAIGTQLQGPLTARERQGLLKARFSGMAVIPALVELAVTRPNLLPNGVTAQEIQDSMEILQVVVAFHSVVSGIADQVEDTMRVMQAQIYKSGLGIYGIALHNTSDPVVKDAVAKMKTAMATGPRVPRYSRTAAPKTKLVRVPADAAAAGSSGTGSSATSSTAGSTSSNSSPATGSAPTATAPQVPVYTPNGQAGTAPATNGK